LLPVMGQTVEPANIASSSSMRLSFLSRNTMRARGSRLILVVDDDADLLGLVETVLREEGYVVATATNGKDALMHIENELPMLILLDMKMPVMDGWEFAATFRAKYDRLVPIVVLTGAQDPKAWAEEIQAAGSLTKPFDLDQLIATVKRYVVDVDKPD